MGEWLPTIALVALLGSGVIGGVFFAFSSFVMRALARIPDAHGHEAMQAINVVVLNRSFLGTFFATAVLSSACVVLGLLLPEHPGAIPFVLGGALYAIGTFAVTIVGNVPLNQGLARVDPTDPAAPAEWRRYVTLWTRWNHVRTSAAILATLSHAVGLLRTV